MDIIGASGTDRGTGGRLAGLLRAAVAPVLVLLLVLAAFPFIMHAAGFGLEGLAGPPEEETHLFGAGRWLSNPAIFAHMVAGAAITLLAPLQLVGAIRRRWPAIHRASGYLVVAGALISGAGGLAYILLVGTIGGPLMDMAFAGYGICLMVAALQAARLARAGDFERHREWALRTFVLAIGSWLYRMHYGLWYASTGGLWSAEDFSGAFDKVQLFAFYVPYLVALEIWLRARRAREQPA